MSELKEGVKIELLRLSPPVLNNNIWNLFEIDKILNVKRGDKGMEMEMGMKMEGEIEKRKHEQKISLSNEFSLSLPLNNKKIYLGQNFKAYINISNSFKINITVISVIVDVLLKNKNTNFSIYRKTEEINLAPDSFFDFITEFHVLFLEIFTIRCMVEYYFGNEKKTVKRNFSFISKIPFNLKSNIIQQNEKVFVEIFLKNTEENSIMLNELRLKDIKCDLIKSDDLLHFSKGIHFFKQNDEYSLTFYVNDEQSKLQILKASKGEKITDIEMKYFTANGGIGINQFYQLKLNTDIQPIIIYLKDPQETFYLHNKLYKLDIAFENNTDETVLLDIYIHNSANIHILNNFVKCSSIEKRKNMSYFFDVIFINPGVYFFNKISIYNKTEKKKLEYYDLFKVCVK